MASSQYVSHGQLTHNGPTQLVEHVTVYCVVLVLLTRVAFAVPVLLTVQRGALVHVFAKLPVHVVIVPPRVMAKEWSLPVIDNEPGVPHAEGVGIAAALVCTCASPPIFSVTPAPVVPVFTEYSVRSVPLTEPDHVSVPVA